MTTLDEILAKKAEYDQALKEFGEKGLKELFTSFFDENPWCEAICWSQYTPYFNDGDECVFSVNDPSFKVTEAFASEHGLGDVTDDWGREGYIDSFTRYTNTGRTEKYIDSWTKRERQRAIYEYQPIFDGAEVYAEKLDPFRKAFTGDELESIFKITFGDHVEVVATREGFDVSDYHHD